MYKRTMLPLITCAPLLIASLKEQVVSPITITSPDLNCTTSTGGQAFTVNSYSLTTTGAEAEKVPASGPGPIAGPLRITKVDDACSPALLNMVLGGSRAKMVTLKDNQANRTITLSGVSFNLDVLSDGEGDKPQEVISMSFDEISITFHSQTTVCWDNRTKRKCAPSGA